MNDASPLQIVDSCLVKNLRNQILNTTHMVLTQIYNQIGYGNLKKLDYMILKSLVVGIYSQVQVVENIYEQ